MATQSTQKRPGLVPKMTVDVNGVPKKVWVRPEEFDGPKQNAKLRDLNPVLNQRFTEGLSNMKSGEKKSSLNHTSEEKRKSSERGYGSEALRKAAARKFERDFGMKLEDAPPVEMSDDELYEYLARGISVEQAHEFARFDIGPEFTHPKLDAEYAFVSDPKVAKLDLHNQEESDSPVRKAELDDIKKTARTLQEMDVDPYVAAQCMSNGLRMEHLKDKSRDLKEIIEVSAENNVASEKFKNIQERPEPIRGIGGHIKNWMHKQRKRAWRSTKSWARRTRRRIVRRIGRRISRRFSRIMKTIFIPWKTR